MTNKLILWAQALDNVSPDHFEVYGVVLDPTDTVKRQEAVSLVSNVIESGSRIFEKSGVRLTADDSHFVLEVPCAQRDSVGRTASIVCYGVYDHNGGNTFGTWPSIVLDAFTKRIDRTFQPEHVELARASFETLKKKSSRKKLLRTVGFGTVGLVLLVTVCWLAQG